MTLADTARPTLARASAAAGRLATRAWQLRVPIGAIVVLVNLIAIAMPLGGIWALRLYESELVRMTESQLIAQGAVVAAAYKAALIEAAGGALDPDYGRPAVYEDPVLAEAAAERARRAAARARFEATGEGETVPEDWPIWLPRLPELDLARHRVLPSAPNTRPATGIPDPAAVAAGEAIMPIIREAQLTTLAGILVTDAEGTVVATTRTLLGHDLTRWMEVTRALEGEHVATLRERETDLTNPPLEGFSRATLVRVFQGIPVMDGNRVIGTVVLSRTPEDLRRALYRQRFSLFFGGGLILALMVTLGVITSFAISRPLSIVAERARRAAGGEREAIEALAQPVTREVGQLSDAVVSLTGSLAAREQYIREFARRISHELKTPIANVKGAAELLTDHVETMAPDQRARFITNIANNAERMQRLVADLLALARAEVARPPSAFTIDFEEALTTAVEEVVALDTLPITLASEVTGLKVSIDADNLESLIGALVENARQHAGPDAAITIRAVPDPVERPAWIVLTVADNGTGIPAHIAGQVFEPFVTTGQDRGSTGLGLAIVRAVAEGHGGSASLLPDGPGAHFEIRLPASSG